MGQFHGNYSPQITYMYIILLEGVNVIAAECNIYTEQEASNKHALLPNARSSHYSDFVIFGLGNILHPWEVSSSYSETPELKLHIWVSL